MNRVFVYSKNNPIGNEKNNGWSTGVNLILFLFSVGLLVALIWTTIDQNNQINQLETLIGEDDDAKRMSVSRNAMSPLDDLQSQIDMLEAQSMVQETTITNLSNQVAELTFELGNHTSLVDLQIYGLQNLLFIMMNAFPGLRWTTELVQPPSDQYNANNFGYGTARRHAFYDIYGAPQFEVVADTDRLVNTQLLNGASSASTVQGQGIFLENGTWSIVLEYDVQRIDGYRETFSLKMVAFDVDDPRVTTPYDGTNLIFDFAGDSPATLQFSEDYWFSPIVYTGAVALSTQFVRRSGMTSGNVQVTGSGAHLHLGVYSSYNVRCCATLRFFHLKIKVLKLA